MDNTAQLMRLGLFDAKVPRYTSYPTAPQFSAGIGPETLGNWLEQLPSGTAISLYLHVPFCRRLCWFCACRTQGTSTAAPVQAYVEALLRELSLVRAHLPHGVSLARLHWGGGTPTLMSPDMMRMLCDAIYEALPPVEGAEFSVEIDPNEIDAARLDALAAGGMTRASVGIQDFDPEIQAAIGREQSLEVTRIAVEALRERGVESLNADILYGLPFQTPARIAASVEKLLSLSPDRVALYGYAHVPWMARRQQMIPSDKLPQPEERLHLFETARRLFLWDDYEEIGIDHFARPGDGLARAAREGRLRRNFQGYTDDTAPALLGLGASAISYLPQGYAQNATGTSAYAQAARHGKLATARGHAFRGDDLLRRRMIEAVMCDLRIDAREMQCDYHARPEALAALFRQAAERFPGMIETSPHGMTIRPEARPLARMIASCFDTYGMSAARHSSAV